MALSAQTSSKLGSWYAKKRQGQALEQARQEFSAFDSAASPTADTGLLASGQPPQTGGPFTVAAPAPVDVSSTQARRDQFDQQGSLASAQDRRDQLGSAQPPSTGGPFTVAEPKPAPTGLLASAPEFAPYEPVLKAPAATPPPITPPRLGTPPAAAPRSAESANDVYARLGVDGPSHGGAWWAEAIASGQMTPADLERSLQEQGFTATTPAPTSPTPPAGAPPAGGPPTTPGTTPPAGAGPSTLDPDDLTSRDIDTETETVAGQLDRLLDENGQYIQTARDRTRRDANARGLLNSSIAASAGEEAAINAALPIATADAGTYGRAGDYNAALQNQAAMYNADAVNRFLEQANSLSSAERVANLQAITQREIAAASQASAAASAAASRYSSDMSAAASRYGNDAQARIAAENNAARTRDAALADARASERQAEHDHNGLVNNVLMNPDIPPERRAEVLRALGEHALADAIYVVGSTAEDLAPSGGQGGWGGPSGESGG